MVFTSIVVPGFFVILYSLQWGKDRSNAWLSSLFLSFFQSLLVVDPLKILIITAIITIILRKPEGEDESLIDSGDPFYNAILNKDEEYLHKSMTSLSDINLREIRDSRKIVLAKLNPVDPVDLETQRLARLHAIRMNEMIREGISYLMFLVVALFLANQSKTPAGSYVYNDISNTFLSQKQFNPTNTSQFSQVNTEKIIKKK